MLTDKLLGAHKKLQTRQGIFLGAPYDGARLLIYDETETAYFIQRAIYNHDKKAWVSGVDPQEWWNKGHVKVLEVNDDLSNNE